VFAVERLSYAGLQPGPLAVLHNHANPGARLQQRPVTSQNLQESQSAKKDA
jgi:hypothetical protein